MLLSFQRPSPPVEGVSLYWMRQGPFPALGAEEYSHFPCGSTSTGVRALASGRVAALTARRKVAADLSSCVLLAKKIFRRRKKPISTGFVACNPACLAAMSSARPSDSPPAEHARPPQRSTPHSPPTGHSDYAYAREPTLAQLQHAPVDLARGHIQDTIPHRFAVELDTTLS